MTGIAALGMIVAIVSFLGFVSENIWLAATRGYVDNRGMRCPFLIGYGIAFLLIYMMFGTPRKLWIFGKTVQVEKRAIAWLIYFAEVMVCICVGEILLGLFVEKTCHLYWWDYSEIPLHITRYTSIPTSVLLAFLVTFFMDRVFPPLYVFFQKQSGPELIAVTVLLLTVMVVDFIVNARKMYRLKRIVRIWRFDLSTGGWLGGFIRRITN